MFKNCKRLTASFLTILVFSTVFIGLFNYSFVSADTTIARVQGNARQQSQSSSVTATLTSQPTSGNVLIAVVSTDTGGSPVTVTGITTTNVSWSKQHSNTVGSINVEIWLGIVSSSAGTSVQASFSGTATALAVINVCEYSGIATTEALDKTATDSGSSSTTNTGTTATTTQDVELWVGGIHTQSWGTAQSDPTNGFTLLDGSYESYWSGSCGYLEKIVSSTGTANTGTTTGDFQWVGCIATFKAYVVESKFPYVEQVSDVDSVTDVGTHSNFTEQQYGPDQLNDTLTEVTTLYNTTLTTQNFEGAYPPTGWTESPSNSKWAQDTSQKHGGTYSAGYEYGTGMVVGDLVSPAYNITGAIALYISFYYYDDDCDANELTYDYYDNTGNWDNIGDLASSTEDTFNNRINVKVTDSQYLHSAFQLRIDGATIGSGENFYVDDFAFIAEYNNYTLFLEEEFTEIPTGYNNKLLCINTGNFNDSESLYVQGWCVGNTSWTTISTLTENQWNNFSVIEWANSDNTTFYIRFIDDLQSADWAQSTWDIDTVYLWCYNYTSSNYSYTLTASITVNNALVSQKGLSKLLTQTITPLASLVYQRSLNRNLLQTITVNMALDDSKALSKPLSESVIVNSALGMNRGLLVLLSQTVSLIDSLAKSFSLTRLLAETVSVAASLLNIKTLTHLFTDSVIINSVMDSAKTVTKTIIETLTDLVNIGDSLATHKTLTNRLVETVLIIADLSTVKSLITNLVEVLTGSISIGDSLVSQKGISKTLTETLSVNSLLTTQKTLIKLFTATVQPLAVLTSNMAVTKYITETLTGLIQPTATLTATKSLTQIFTASISILSSIAETIHQNIQALTFLLAENIQITETPQISLALAFAFLELVDSVTISDLFQWELPLTSEEWFIIGGFLAAIIIGVFALALFFGFRKNDDY